jgi:hypothetical protein
MAIAVACPASALAHDTYVDRTDGTGGTNDCTEATNPCFSLTKGIANAGHGDTVFVGGDPHVYESPHTLDDGKSLVGKNFSTTPGIETSGEIKLDAASTTQPALTIAGKAGVVRNVTIRSAHLPLEIDAPVTIKNDEFSDSHQVPAEIMISAGAGSPRIVDSDFFGKTSLTTSYDQVGIQSASPDSPLIRGNFFFGLTEGIVALGGGAPRIEDGHFSAIHSGASAGAAINAYGTGTNPAIVHNRIIDPVDVATEVVNGIVVHGGATASISRTRVKGYDHELTLDDAAGTSKLDNDILQPKTGQIGLMLLDEGTDDPNVSNARGTNLTIWGDGLEVSNNSATLTLDSSIIGVSGIQGDVNEHCSLKYSRGPVKQSGGGGCKDFQTKADPKFKSNGYLLKPSSPMIDKGNPHEPPHGAKDYQGDERSLPGDCGARHPKARRDIGADEFRCRGHHRG